MSYPLCIGPDHQYNSFVGAEAFDDLVCFTVYSWVFRLWCTNDNKYVCEGNCKLSYSCFLVFVIGCSVFLLANYFRFNYVYTSVFIGFPILSSILLFFLIPDSPQALMARNKVEAEKSLQFYRNDKNYKLRQWEYSDLTKEKQNSSIRNELRSRSIRNAFLFGTVLCLFLEFSGIMVLKYLSGIIFRDSESVLSPNMSSVITTGIKFIASLISTALVDLIRRIVLLAFSGLGMALGNTGLGVYNWN